MLRDFKALLIPAGRALAFGYFTNFVNPLSDTLPEGQEDELKIPDSKLRLAFSSFRIRIGVPARPEDANDPTVREIRRSQLGEINIKGTRRAFRVYVPRKVKETIDKAMRTSLEQKDQDDTSHKLHFDCFDVVDFATPMFAVYEFVRTLEQELLRDSARESSAMGYWQRQKDIQHKEFIESLKNFVTEEGKQRYVDYFDFTNAQDFKLPE